MSSFIYIPTNDPFATLGVILLVTLTIVFLVILIFTARRSAQDARKAVRDRSRYQRLMQLYWNEERRSLREMDDGRDKGKGKDRVEVIGRDEATAGPRITVTAPTASSSLRSNAASGIAPSHRSRHDNAGETKHREDMLEEHDLSTASTHLPGVVAPPRHCPRQNPRPSHMERLPRILRIGRPKTPSSRPPRRSAYRRLNEENHTGDEGENAM